MPLAGEICRVIVHDRGPHLGSLTEMGDGVADPARQECGYGHRRKSWCPLARLRRAWWWRWQLVHPRT